MIKYIFTALACLFFGGAISAIGNSIVAPDHFYKMWELGFSGVLALLSIASAILSVSVKD